MDLVTRLRTYIDFIAMPVTQFADTCGIPRPSMSQLLSGRNKKVSNELISKIHDAFPDLNVLWLMFGQGDMLVKQNSPLSEPQNDVFEDHYTQQSAKPQNVAKTILDFGTVQDSESENLKGQNAGRTPLNQKVQEIDNEVVGDDGQSPASKSSAPLPSGSAKSSVACGAVQSIALQSDRSKRIVNIIVYYSDNSFEAFVPEQYTTNP